MNLKEWRGQQQRTKDVDLPSGLTVTVQPVPMQAFLRGRIPDSITPIVTEMLESGGLIPAVKTLDEARAWFDLIDAVALAAIVSPRVVPDGQATGDDELAVGELSEADKSSLLLLLGATAKALESFRPQSPDDVDTVLPGEGDEPATE